MKLNRGEPDHPHWKTPLSRREKAWAWLGLGGCFLMLACVRWVDPQHPPFTGRWSSLQSAVHDAFGVHGMAVAYGVLGAVFVLAGGLQGVRSR
jgi:hypothetical protein